MQITFASVLKVRAVPLRNAPEEKPGKFPHQKRIDVCLLKGTG
jgi:hypothetical protein